MLNITNVPRAFICLEFGVRAHIIVTDEVKDDAVLVRELAASVKVVVADDRVDVADDRVAVEDDRLEAA